MVSAIESTYLTETTSSLDEFSKSFEYLIPGSKVYSNQSSDIFNSIGDGFVSEGFFLGRNLTKDLKAIRIEESNSCLFTIPLKGTYQTRTSGKAFINCTPKKGSLLMPNNTIDYIANAKVVEDLIIIIDYDQVKAVLDKNFATSKVENRGFALEKKNDKVQMIHNLITYNLQVLKNYPHFRSSIHYKASLKEMSKIFMAEIVAYSHGLESKLNTFPESPLVKKAEEMISAHPEKYFNVLQIADKLYTSARNLQLAFKKNRRYSPMQFLKEQKLHKARIMLLNSNSNELIKAVAIKSGFLDYGSFSKSYREKYGELPSETIQQSS